MACFQSLHFSGRKLKASGTATGNAQGLLGPFTSSNANFLASAQNGNAVVRHNLSSCHNALVNLLFFASRQHKKHTNAQSPARANSLLGPRPI